MGDRIEPGEPLVELEPIDAKLAVDEAESKYLGALVKLGVTRQQAEDAVRTYGISEDLLNNRTTGEAIARSPSIVEKRIAREKAMQNLARQRALTQRGAGTNQELDDAENEYRTAVAAYENAVLTARNAIAEAYAARVSLNKAEQSLREMTIRAPDPKRPPADLAGTDRVHYALSHAPGLRGADAQAGRGGRRPRDRGPAAALDPRPRALCRCRSTSASSSGSRRGAPRHVVRGEGRADQPVGRPVEPDVPGRDAGPQHARAAPPRRLGEGVDRDRRAGERHAVVPIEAVVHFAGVTKIFLVDQGKAQAIDDIKTGVEGAGWVEIIGKQLPTPATSSPPGRPTSPTAARSSSANPSKAVCAESRPSPLISWL